MTDNPEDSRISGGRMAFIVFGLLILTVQISCSTEDAAVSSKSDEGKEQIIDHTPCNPDSSNNTRAVLKYIAALSEDRIPGVIVGQNCGHASDIYDSKNIMSYDRLVKGLHYVTGKWVGILGVDYGHNRCFTPSEIHQANKVLIDYWNRGGLVSVGFSPLNPWLNDETDLIRNPGDWTQTRTAQLNPAQKDQIDLCKLIDPTEPVHAVWRRKLDRIADGLTELRDAGIVVLFKPMQEQNGFWFWWGTGSSPQDPGPYVALYRDLFEYFTNERGLNNILWLYSPNKNSRIHQGIKPLMWNYPGNEYVDIIAPTSYNDKSWVPAYEVLLKSGKPLGMAEFGPHHDGNNGSFDNRQYIESLAGNFPRIAFWITWHDWENGDGTQTRMSLIGNQNAEELMNDKRVITRDDVDWRN